MRIEKVHIIALAACLWTAAGLFSSCHQGPSDNDNLSDSDKLELLDIKIDRHPKDADLRYRRAQVYLNLRRPTEAINDLTNAISLDGKQLDYYLLLADAQFANGNVEQSYKALTRANELDPDNLDVQLKMGEITFYSRDYDRSFEALNKVTAHEPDNRTALFMKGFIYKEKGDTANAVTLLRRVADLYPDYAAPFEELGVLFASRHNPMAVEYLSTALRLEPSNTNAMYALAMYYQDLKEMDQAEELYRRMLVVNPNSVDAYHNLGFIELTFYSDYQRAVAFFDSALAIDPQMSAAIDNRQLALDALNGKIK